MNEDFISKARKYKIHVSTTDPYSPWQNSPNTIFESPMEEHKAVRQGVRFQNTIWIDIYCTTGTDSQTHIERLTGNTINISDWNDFELYDLV